jgi:hypothetical protein
MKRKRRFKLAIVASSRRGRDNKTVMRLTLPRCSTRPSCLFGAPLTTFVLVALLGGCTEPAKSSARVLQLGACGDVPTTGCCEGNTLKYCAANSSGSALVSVRCSFSCGWIAVFGIYGCDTPIDEDPAGTPRACPSSAYPDAGLARDAARPKDAGAPDATWMDAGSADSASGFDTGFDSASGFDASLRFDAVVPTADLARDMPSVDAASGCGTIRSVGCCFGQRLRFCALGSLVAVDCGAVSLACGWDHQRQQYACGGSGADPSGAYPIDCGESFDMGPPRLDSGASDSNALDLTMTDASDATARDRGVGDLSITLDRGPSDLGVADMASGDNAVPPGLDLSRFDAFVGDIKRVRASGGGGCTLSAGKDVPPSTTLGSCAFWGLLGLFLLLARCRR